MNEEGSRGMIGPRDTVGTGEFVSAMLFFLAHSITKLYHVHKIS